MPCQHRYFRYVTVFYVNSKPWCGIQQQKPRKCLCWHGIILHLLYIGPDGGLINLNHVTYDSETEYVVCRLLTFFIYCFVCDAIATQWARASSFMRFLDHRRRRTTVGRTPLDEWSARCRDLWHHTTLTTDMPPVGFEPTISAGERPQTYALDRAATGSGNFSTLSCTFIISGPKTGTSARFIVHPEFSKEPYCSW